MVRVSRRRLSQTVVRLLREHPERRTQIVRSLAAYLIVTRRSRERHLVLADIARELFTREHHLYAEVRSAFALDANTRVELETFLRHLTSADSVELTEQTDPSLLTGLIVRTASGDEWDTSAARKLRSLTSLTTGDTV